MLRRDVVDSVRSGQFHVHSVETIDQGIEILTGIPHGRREASGHYPADTIGARVEQRLRAMARNQAAFMKAAQGDLERSPA
jgi:hypothetical protein